MIDTIIVHSKKLHCHDVEETHKTMYQKKETRFDQNDSIDTTILLEAYYHAPVVYCMI